jgi:peptidoglycan/LPS O-acetylase OafA/YrhL
MTLTLQTNYSFDNKRQFFFHGNIFKFWWNRYLRLAPLYFLVSLFSITCMWSFPKLAKNYSLAEAFMIPPYMGILIAPGWSLNNEVLFYLLIPFVLLIPFRDYVIPFLGLIVLILTFDHRPETPFPSPFSLSTDATYLPAVINSMVYFLMGIGLKLWIPWRTNNLLRNVGFSLMIGVILIDSICRREIEVSYPLQAFIGIATILSTVSVLIAWGGDESAGSKRFGDLTYPLFLIHAPLLFAITETPLRDIYVTILSFFPSNIENYVHAFFITLISIVVSLVWLKVEKQTFHKLRSNKV